MEQIGQQLKQNFSKTITTIGEYLCWFLARSNQKLKQLLGDQNHRMIAQFLDKHAFACIFGSMVMTACVFHVRYRRKMINEPVVSSDHSKSKKSTSYRLPQKLKSKIKFASQDEEDYQNRKSQNLTTQHYESTLQSKKERRKTVPKKRKNNDEYFEETLQKQANKAKGENVVLDDSKSDKIFNQMYGMYQQALR